MSKCMERSCKKTAVDGKRKCKGHVTAHGPQLNIRIHEDELKRYKRQAKKEGFPKFSQWVKHYLHLAAGIKNDPADDRKV